MKYLPVFQELFESDSIVFMLIGLIFAVFIGIKMNDTRQTIFSHSHLLWRAEEEETERIL